MSIKAGNVMKYDFDLDLVFNNSLSLIAKQIRRKTRVLEFGPANGRLTKYMKEQLDCDIYLVEIDEVAGKQAAVYAKDIVLGDIEQYEWQMQYNGILFDYIIFADVLEHLRNPEEVLKRAKLFLAQEGSILLSVPNVAHNSVIINLVNGIFDYTSIGLLDNTHIHFFTKKSLEEMLFNAGLEPVKKMGTYNEVGNNEIINNYRDVIGIDEDFWKRREYGEVYQFIYEVKNGNEYVEVREDILKKYYKPYYIQCFLSDGQDFSEDYSFTRNLVDLKKDMTFEFDIEEEITKFRIDPINKECIIENFKCEIFDGNSWIDLEYCDTNADAIEAGQYYFFNRDPYFNYSLSKRNIQKIRVTLSFITLDINKINLIYDMMVKIKKSM